MGYVHILNSHIIFYTALLEGYIYSVYIYFDGILPWIPVETISVLTQYNALLMSNKKIIRKIFSLAFYRGLENKWALALSNK